MTRAWKKRYAFRLQETDEELGAFLEQVPHSQTSQVIREMLRWAYRKMKQEQVEQKQLHLLMEEIRSLRESQDASFEAIQKQLSQLGTSGNLLTSDEAQPDDEEKVADKQVKETAQAILDSFGF